MAEFGFANCPTQVESGHPRHHPGPDDDTDICLFDAGEAFQALTRILRLVPQCFEQCADVDANVRCIIDDNGFHGFR